MLENVEILVDLQTGAISVVIPGTEASSGSIELETVIATDEFAPRE